MQHGCMLSSVDLSVCLSYPVPTVTFLSLDLKLYFYTLVRLHDI